MKWVDPGVKDREVQLQAPLWNEAGTKAVLVARATDNKDRWILALDPATGKTRVLFTEHDDAWLNGPGAQTLGWLKNGNEIYFESERERLFAPVYDRLRRRRSEAINVGKV